MAEYFRGDVEGEIIFGAGPQVHGFLEYLLPVVGLIEGKEFGECPSDALQTLVEVELQKLDIVDLFLELLRTQALEVALDLIDEVGERVNSEI